MTELRMRDAIRDALREEMLRDERVFLLGDAAGLASEATGYEDWIAPGLPQRTARSARLVTGAAHAHALRELGLDADIAHAAREDTSHAVPRVAAHGEGWALLRDG